MVFIAKCHYFLFSHEAVAAQVNLVFLIGIISHLCIARSRSVGVVRNDCTRVAVRRVVRDDLDAGVAHDVACEEKEINNTM